MSERLAYTVKILGVGARAVCVDVQGTSLRAWLPKSQVEFPDDVRRGDVLDVEIPAWIIDNESKAQRAE